MNIRETISIRSPNGKEEKCAKFTIDDIAMPFVFESVTDIDEEYVFSAWMMSDGNSSITVENNELSLSTEWQKQKVVFNASDNSLKIYFNNIGIYYFYHSQLESGNIETDWSPSPKDLEAELELKVNSEDLISEINASANVIRLKSNRLVVESDNLQIYEDGTLKTQRGEIGGFILHDKILSAEADKHAEINIKYHTYADAEPREGFIKIGNDAENEGGSGEGGIYVQDYDLDGYEVYTRIGNVLGGGILIETEERNEGLRVGYDGIYRVAGVTNISGTDVHIYSSEAGNVGARPYWRKGDTLSYNLRTAGFVTNGGKEVHFTVPLNRMVLGSGLTVTAASTSGFILRQDAKYTHGSASSTYAKPTKYSATIYTNYIYVVATFSSTTNVINNAPCGIVWSGTITIS